jgi:hypothetical protein
MVKLYTLAYVDIAELRDSKLAALFDEDNDEVFKGKWEYLWLNCNQLTKLFDLRLKTYKTLNGDNRAALNINQTYNGRGIRLRGGYWDQKTSRYVSSIQFDNTQKKIVPLEITGEWNKAIEDLLKKEKENYERKVKKLIDKKVS